MTPGERRPRVRPDLLLAMVLLGWWMIHERLDGFAGAAVGATAGILMVFVMRRMAPPGRRKGVPIAGVVLCLFVTAVGFLGVSRDEGPLGVVIASHVGWDAETQEFIVRVMGTPDVAERCASGELSVLAMVRVVERCYDLPFGDSRLDGRSRRVPSEVRYQEVRGVGSLRVPCRVEMPSHMESRIGPVREIRVSAVRLALADGDGNLVSPVYETRFESGPRFQVKVIYLPTPPPR